jgi:hypothetical protein
MRLDEDEIKVKTFFHHPIPFAILLVKTAVVSFPFYLVATFFNGLLDPTRMFLTYLVISAVFALVMIYETFLYFIDRLVVTNKRIVHLEWKSLFNSDESGAEFSEIQDIETKVHGILSTISIFNFGSFILETSATHTGITFLNATNPEAIKHFVYHLQQKPTRIEAEPPFETPLYDRTKAESDKESSFTGSSK